MSFEDLGLANRLTMLTDGQKVIDVFERILHDLTYLDSDDLEDFPYQPVVLLLIDINMPLVDGFEAIKTIKHMYKDVNQRHQQETGSNEDKIIRPLICYYSQ